MDKFISSLVNKCRIHSIQTEKEEQECADELDEEIRALTKQASEKTYIGGLTKECVDAFVSMVYLYDDQTMKIEFNCRIRLCYRAWWRWQGER